MPNRERIPFPGCTERPNAYMTDICDDQKHTSPWTRAVLPRERSKWLILNAPARGAHEPPAATSPEKATLFGTLVHLWPYIWPGDRADLKMRVVWSVVLLLVAKLATLSVPFTFEWAIDALTGVNTAPVEASNWTLWLIASPLLMTVSYGAVRVLMAVLTQWRDGIFARVAMHAVRELAYLTFVHMHELSLRFHLERKTGGLTRVLERGRTGIEVIVRMVILQLIPTIVEVRCCGACCCGSSTGATCWSPWSWSWCSCTTPISRPNGGSRSAAR